MKIAVVRGVHLNPFELQLFAPLSRRHAVLAVGATWQFYPFPIRVPSVSVKSAALSGRWLAVFGSDWPWHYHRIQSRLFGRSFGLEDLESLVDTPDILHAAETYHTMTYQCLEIKRRRGCRLVVTVSENLPGRGESHPVRRRRKAEVLREADLFIAITPKTQQLLQSEGVPAERISLLPMSVDTDRFSAGPPDLDLNARLAFAPEDRLLLFIGRFAAEKGIDDLLRSIPAISNLMRRDRWRLLFVGGGPLLEHIRQARMRYPDLIRIHRFMPYEDIPALHRRADLLVLPSRATPTVAEQFGFVLVESMASGKAVLTTRVGSVPEVVADGARLVASNSPAALSQALEQLMRAPAERERLGRQGRDRVLQAFDAEKNAARLEALYTTLLSSGTSGNKS
jgi:glycosyltransferase involved in cell wall biosynthesis